MIVRIAHPETPDVQVFVPVTYGRQEGAWIPLCEEGGYFSSATDAVRVCLIRVLAIWMTIVDESRVMRALCEHPEFDFVHDGIDHDMVRRRAKLLAKGITDLTPDLESLLNEPGDDDEVVVGGQRLRAARITGARYLPDLELSMRTEAQGLDIGSADAHGQDEGAEVIAAAALAACRQLDADTIRVYSDIIFSKLPETAARALEKLMDLRAYPYPISDWAKKHYGQGAIEASRAMLRGLLAQRFGELPPEIDQKLDGAEQEQLMRWSLCLGNASELDDVFSAE